MVATRNTGANKNKQEEMETIFGKTRYGELWELQETKDKSEKFSDKEKERAWKEFGEKLEEDSKGNQKLFCRMLKSLRTGKAVQTKKIKNATGEIITDV